METPEVDKQTQEILQKDTAVPESMKGFAIDAAKSREGLIAQGQKEEKELGLVHVNFHCRKKYKKLKICGKIQICL